MDLLKNIDILSVAIAVAGTFVLGFTVYFNDRRSITNQTLFAFSAITGIWGLVNFFGYRIANPDIAIILLRISLFLAVLQAFAIFQLFYIFPKKIFSFSKIYLYLLIPITIVTASISVTPLVLQRVGEVSATGRILTIINGPAIPLFGLINISLVILALYVFLKSLLKASAKQKSAYTPVLIGTAMMFVCIIIFNFILPALFDDSRYIPFGALFTFPFMIFTSYAILKQKLFNVRVAGTAVLVFLLAIVTFFEVIFAGGLSLIIYRSSVFLLVLSFGIMLIRGVLREVEQREKFAELNKQLQLAYQEVEKLSRAKSEFISIASHQLRTPLTAIKGYISMILEGSYGKFPDKAKKPLENVYKSNERLVNLVNDLLSISRIESGKIKFEPELVSVEDVIEGVIFDLNINAEKKHLYLKFEKPAEKIPELQLDKVKLRDIILNFTDNAIKYTPQGGVTVNAKMQDGKLQVRVRDTGEGMDQEEIKTLFESFTRGTVGVKSYTEGAGLGLYIARRYAEMHGGRVWAESEGKGKGSTFCLEIPAHQT